MSPRGPRGSTSRLLTAMSLAALLFGGGTAQAALSKAEEALNRGVKLILLNKAQEALPHLQTAVRADPKLAMAHYNLGVALKMTGKHDAAIKAFREAYARTNSPSLKAQALFGIALAFEGKKAWNQAADAWQAVQGAISGLPNEARLRPIVQKNIELAQKKGGKKGAGGSAAGVEP